MTTPAQPTEEYFNSSRLKVIGMITAATVAVGALGGIGGVIFDKDPVHVRPAPSVSDAQSGTGGGQARLRLPVAAEEDSYVALDNGVEIFIPAGWEVFFQNVANINFTNNQGAYAYAFSSSGFDQASAADVVLDNIDGILPPDVYTDRSVGDFQPWGEPFGTVVSVGYLEYQAVWVDNQGSQAIYGQIYAGVRDDGTALIYLIEAIPPDNFNTSFENLPLVTNTFGRFGGVS